MTSVNLSALPGISFTPQDAVDVESSVINSYETIAQVTLERGDPVRLFLESLAYLLAVQNSLIDLAGRQNLLAFAGGAHLDHLGALMGVARIPAQPSRCLLRFAIAAPLDFEIPIPAGTRVTTQTGTPQFATAADAVIMPGELEVEAVAFAVDAGGNANGLSLGQLSRLVNPLPYVTEVGNTSQTMQGADVEGDERLRNRIRIAPESFTVAGSEDAYLARTLEVSQDIEAATISSPMPGLVDVRFVLTGGELPDAAMIALVQNHLSGETVRPLTDTVNVAAPDVVEYAVEGRWFLRRADATILSAVTRAVDEAVEAYRIWQRSQPGRDINPTRLISLVERAVAKRVELTGTVFTVLKNTQIARETAVEFVFGGMEDD